MSAQIVDIRLHEVFHRREERIAATQALASKQSTTARRLADGISAWCGFCDVNGFVDRPATCESLRHYAQFLLDEGFKRNTIEHRLWSVSRFHADAGLADPTKALAFASFWTDLLSVTRDDEKRAPALLPPDLFRLADVWSGNNLQSLRNRAMLLIGWAGAFRREELVRIAAADVAVGPDGATITLWRSKTNHDGRGRTKLFPRVGGDYCPVAALEAWLAVRSIGALLWPNLVDAVQLSPSAFNAIFAKSVKFAGLAGLGYTPHSLRAGYITWCNQRGISNEQIALQSHHRPGSRVLDEYKREVCGLKNSPLSRGWS